MDIDVLGDTKILLGITNTLKDSILSIYLRRAVPLIQRYLNISPIAISTTDMYSVITTTEPIDVTLTYGDAVIQFAVESYRRKGKEGIKSGTTGSVSQVYNNSLSDTVISLLPMPYVTLFSTRPDYWNDDCYEQ